MTDRPPDGARTLPADYHCFMIYDSSAKAISYSRDGHWVLQTDAELSAPRGAAHDMVTDLWRLGYYNSAGELVEARTTPSFFFAQRWTLLGEM
jgi:hypothetical protein